MMKQTFFLSILFAAAITVISCEYDREEEEIAVVDTDTSATDTSTTDTSTTDTTTTPVADTYENKIKAIVDLNCATETSCHGGGAGAGDFTSYATLKVQAENGNLKKHVVDSDYMPYGTDFDTPTDRKVFEDWLLDGAKEK